MADARGGVLKRFSGTLLTRGFNIFKWKWFFMKILPLGLFVLESTPFDKILDLFQKVMAFKRKLKM